MNMSSMINKINTIKQNRSWLSWDNSNPKYIKSLKDNNNNDNRPNILFILADDLGYGDLSVDPFIFNSNSNNKSQHYFDPNYPCDGNTNIFTPNLERMALKGTILTNFHSASPVCSPSRVSIMTSLFPFRINALNAFELGNFDLTQRNGYLPQFPTGPEIFRGAGYYTAHSGKWHMGGMREVIRSDRANKNICLIPGPNQHGFEEYISALDGPESPRYTFLLQPENSLHTQGYRHRIKDDVPMPMDDNDLKSTILSDVEAADAINLIKKHKKKNPNQPWFVQVWFNAPHSPWEVVPSGEDFYSKKYNKTADYWKSFKCPDKSMLHEQRSWQYRTMVTGMDKSIGMLLDAIEDMGEESKTLIVFTSDNGPEAGAGSAGPFQGRKRSLKEGGIRVPAILQWVGTIPGGKKVNQWASTIDLLPTFMEAAKIRKPSFIEWDGLSFYSSILKLNKDTTTDSSYQLMKNWFTGSTTTTNQHYSRVFLWHKVTELNYKEEPPNKSAGHYQQVKVIVKNEGFTGCIEYIYDHKYDHYENKNLLKNNEFCALFFYTYDQYTEPHLLKKFIDPEAGYAHCKVQYRKQHGTNMNECKEKYVLSLSKKVIVILDSLKPFVLKGNIPFFKYTLERHDDCKVPLITDLSRPIFYDPLLCMDNTKKSLCNTPMISYQ